MANTSLHAAKDAKNDEFYTRLEDINEEMKVCLGDIGTTSISTVSVRERLSKRLLMKSKMKLSVLSVMMKQKLSKVFTNILSLGKKSIFHFVSSMIRLSVRSMKINIINALIATEPLMVIPTQMIRPNMSIMRWKATISFLGLRAVKQKNPTVRCFVSGTTVISRIIK